MDIPTGFTLKSEEFQPQISLKLLTSKFGTFLAHLRLFSFYSPLLTHAHALTWCTHDNPIHVAPAIQYILETLHELRHTVNESTKVQTLSAIYPCCKYAMSEAYQFIKAGSDVDECCLQHHTNCTQRYVCNLQWVLLVVG